jgi:hypothetical protein
MRFFMDSALGMVRRLVCITVLLSPAAFAQTGSPSATPAIPQDLDAEIRSLTESLEQTRSELAQSRTEIKQLRTALDEVISRVNGLRPAAAAEEKAVVAESPKNMANPTPGEGQGQANISQDDWDILNARIEEQRQVKVESGARYRLKLSGLVLFNVSAIGGHVNNLDLPDVAVPTSPGSSSGSLSASVRQSIVGLTGIGPEVLGARTSGDLQMDFFGGLPGCGWIGRTPPLLLASTIRSFLQIPRRPTCLSPSRGWHPLATCGVGRPPSGWSSDSMALFHRSRSKQAF